MIVYKVRKSTRCKYFCIKFAVHILRFFLKRATLKTLRFQFTFKGDWKCLTQNEEVSWETNEDELTDNHRNLQR